MLTSLQVETPPHTATSNCLVCSTLLYIPPPSLWLVDQLQQYVVVVVVVVVVVCVCLCLGGVVQYGV